MKIRLHTVTVNRSAELMLAADVSRDTLHLFSRIPAAANPDSRLAGGPPQTLTIEDVIDNRTPAIEAALERVLALAAEHGIRNVRVLCESSGGFERPLLAVARRLGMQTALVSPERVKDLKRVESLGTGKTDRKDARVIHLAGSMGKTQRHRVLPERYQLLRRLTAFHDDEVTVITALRTRLAYTLNESFPDYDRPVSFTYSRTGRVLLASHETMGRPASPASAC
jgi:hypothetical protein